MFKGRFESSLPFSLCLFKLNDGFSGRLAPVRFRQTGIPGSATKPPQLIVGHFSQAGSQLFAGDRRVAR